jgi:hypothetical protein
MINIELMKLINYDNFCNFSNDVVESTPNFELELEIYLKEPASTDIIKNIDRSRS